MSHRINEQVLDQIRSYLLKHVSDPEIRKIVDQKCYCNSCQEWMNLLAKTISRRQGRIDLIVIQGAN